MSNFYNPAPGSEIRILFLFFLFFSTRPNMRSISPLLYHFSTARISCIKTKILRMPLGAFGTENHNSIQCSFKQFDVMSVSSIKNNRQRKSVLISQNASFCAHFFPDR